MKKRQEDELYSTLLGGDNIIDRQVKASEEGTYKYKYKSTYVYAIIT